MILTAPLRPNRQLFNLERIIKTRYIIKAKYNEQRVLHKITLLGCLLLLITSSVGSDKGFQTAGAYARLYKSNFA